MVGQLLKTIYKYENVELASGFKVNAQEVTIQEDKVVNVSNAVVTNDGTDSWNFSINNYGGSIKYNINNVPASVDGQAIVEEFVTFVENDIV